MNKSNYMTLSGTLVNDAIKNDLIKEGKLGPDFVPDNLLLQLIKIVKTLDLIICTDV